jgi:hypothetical protein
VSLWTCALYYVEESEIEQILVDRHGRGMVRSFKMGLLEYVDKAEKGCFTTRVARRGRNVGGDSESSNNEQDSEGDSSHTRWSWEASIGCWFRKDPGSQDTTPKRRKITRISYPSPQRSSPSEIPLPRTFRRMDEMHVGGPSIAFSPTDQHDSNPASSCTPDDAQKAPRDFFCLLTNALSSRTSLHGGMHHTTRHTSNDTKGVATEEGLDMEDGEESDTDSDGSNHIWGIRTSDLGDHALSEDHLDLFKIASTSPFLRR